MVINKCVACGGGCNGEYDHHCDPQAIRRRDSAMKAERQASICRNYMTRLAEGFRLLSQAGDRN